MTIRIFDKGQGFRAFSLPEMLVVLVIIGILVLIALPNLMPLISKAKAMEAQQQLAFVHTLQKSYFYTYSRYSDSLDEIGFEQQPLVTEEGNANYRIEIIEAGESGFKAHAISVVDFDKDGLADLIQRNGTTAYTPRSCGASHIWNLWELKTFLTVPEIMGIFAAILGGCTYGTL